MKRLSLGQFDLFPTTPPGAEGVWVGYVVIPSDHAAALANGVGRVDLNDKDMFAYRRRIDLSVLTYGVFLNGMTVVVDTRGLVTDGRCTLDAIAASGMHGIVLLVRGVEPGSVMTTDIGLRRVPDGGLDGFVPPVSYPSDMPVDLMLERIIAEGPRASIVSLDKAFVIHRWPDLAKHPWTKPERGAIARMAADHVAGAKRFNGQSFKVSASGRILDGLKSAAVVLATGKPMTVVLVENIHDGFAGTYDTGRSKSFGTKLTNLGVNQGYAVAGGLRMIEAILKNDPGAKPPPGRMAELREAYPGMEHHLNVAKTEALTELISPSATLGILALVPARSRDRALAFFRELAAHPDTSGPGMFPRLRAALRLEGRNTGGKAGDMRRARLAVLTLNAYLAGKTRTRLIHGTRVPRIEA